MDVVDAILEGDVIERVEIVPGSRAIAHALVAPAVRPVRSTRRRARWTRCARRGIAVDRSDGIESDARRASTIPQDLLSAAGVASAALDYDPQPLGLPGARAAPSRRTSRAAA